ncbi:MAG TPA: cation diffusion facilitator family transporter [Clostridia bacterium]|nr:cation diffusion facilitator family transporter [Clostridia bacterium]
MSVASKTKIGKRVALVSIAVSATLALTKIIVGLLANSTAVVADGVESAGDVVASGFVLFGFVIAERPADDNHPYGHGRYETLTGLVVGIILVLGGIGIAYRSLQHVGETHAAPALYGIWPLLLSMVSKAALSAVKFRYGRKIGSSALIADAWNDFVDILSAVTAMTALGLTLYDPSRFLAADHYGGFAVGLIVIITGFRVAKDTSDRLTDTMPPPELLEEIRSVAKKVDGVYDVEKCYARSGGLQYYVDLHLEVDPEMTVSRSHDIATEVRFAIRNQLDWVADVLVHVEPAPAKPHQNSTGLAPAT